ncbi:heme ABC exporter, ATP-binding protein CcmA [Bordetella bronchiseptica CA90 BB1334]|uniref:cytochrome c biogenesis heme-transporting ATPase CcmA n=1 Tax=Alcaligenaceae TaxID=506 RepID=UPI0004614C45|nr:cytochrome c biogenesis heme-transporting ATPase CcmA [Bordetella bronchiseptica]KDB77622.1 heme ABC exporter, ATP-binding protein CcmA [Bordetella bronchiseptica CA90 BB1334]KDD41879.1 heme ABC exporter, ATP-binding protein CcmA [Bordetella bronchiseptica OSU095]
MLEAMDLGCMRAERPLFKALALHVAPGECLFVRGRNGSGKTSLLRILAGLTRPARGKVLWQGLGISQPGSGYRGQFFYVGHADGLNGELSAAENLRALQSASGDAHRPAAIACALRDTGLEGKEHLPVRALSAGQKRRAALARLLATFRPLWILDEPVTALDATAHAWLARAMDRHLREGGAIVATSHQEIALDHAHKQIRLEP